MKTETIILEKTARNDPWEGCVNGVNYRIQRGEPVEVPAFLADLIRQCEYERKQSHDRVSAYTAPSGAKLY